MQSLERISLTPQHSLHLVRVAGRVLLVAVSPGGCSVLEGPGWDGVDDGKVRELPKRNFPALMQAVVMIPVFGLAIYYLVKDDFAGYLSLSLKSLPAGSAQVASSMESLLWKASSLFVVFGFVDLLRQQRRYTKELRMSKQEIRDEVKEVE